MTNIYHFTEKAKDKPVSSVSVGPPPPQPEDRLHGCQYLATFLHCFCTGKTQSKIPLHPTLTHTHSPSIMAARPMRCAAQ